MYIDIISLHATAAVFPELPFIVPNQETPIISYCSVITCVYIITMCIYLSIYLSIYRSIHMSRLSLSLCMYVMYVCMYVRTYVCNVM